MSDLVSDYVSGLPEASGTFAGTFDPGAVDGLLGPAPGLLPIEIDTYDQPNPALTKALGKGQFLIVTVEDRAWTFSIDHVEPLKGNRARVWCKRPV